METASQARYNKENTIYVGLRFNKKTDADIIEAINDKAKNTEIKRLIRLGLEAEKKGAD